MKRLTVHAEIIRGFLAGFLLVLCVLILKDSSETATMFLLSCFAVVIGFFFAKKTLRYMHRTVHDRIEETAVQVIVPVLLLVVNIVHPAVDGFSLYETFLRGGVAIGIIAIIGIFLHEVIRQWALIIAFAKMGIRKPWLIIVTALIGISMGVTFGYFGTYILHDHEGSIDVVTLFAYSFIITEFLFTDHHKENENLNHKKWKPLVVGIVVAIVYTFIFSGH